MRRANRSIREYLEYYVLVLLARTPHWNSTQRPWTKGLLMAAIKKESAGNRSYRRTGDLSVQRSDMDAVLRTLAAKGSIKAAPGRGKWAITAKGKRVRAEIEQISKCPPGGKERAAQALLALANCRRNATRVLDVGTGEGFLAFKLAERGCDVLGIDSGSFNYSKESIQKATEKARGNGKTVLFRKADVRRLRGLDGAFDLVTSSQAVHCMKDQNACLRAIYRLLKPGGRFFCLDFSVGVKAFLAHGFHTFLAPSVEEWQALLAGLHFQDTRIQNFDDYLVVSAQRPITRASGPNNAFPGARRASTASKRRRA